MRARTYLPAFIVLVLVGALHMVGIYYKLYFFIPRFDVLLHFLGGLWVGLTALWLYDELGARGGISTQHSFFRPLIWVVSASLCAAVCWELFELTNNITNQYMSTSAGLSYAEDSLKDICLGVIGGLVGFLFHKK